MPPDQPATTPPTTRLKSTKAFLDVYRRGRWVHGPLLSLGIRPNAAGGPRLGLRTKRGLKGAVVRNRLKRQLRAVVQRAERRITSDAIDIVVVVHPRQLPVTSDELAIEFERLGRRARVLTP